MNLALRIIVPICVVALAVLVHSWLVLNPPPAERRPGSASVTTVEVMDLFPRDYRIRIPSQGVVLPRTRTILLPQVSGRITEVVPNFRDGGFFEKDDVLMRIDPSDYRTALTVAESLLLQRQAELELEEAQQEQARENWELLGEGASPTALLVREPQLRMAQANVDSAQARIEEARRNLERTVIRAPYAGRVLKKWVDVGQTVQPGTRLAEIFAVDYVEIRLPLLNEHLELVDIPERYREGEPAGRRVEPGVTIRGRFGSREIRWRGRIVRSEGAFDAGTRQLFVIAQVDDPYSMTEPGRPPLKINQYVEADIEGRLLKDVFVIPRSAIRESREVLIVGEGNRIERREIRLIWSRGEQVVVRDDLEPGERLCLTSLPLAVNGAEVDPQAVAGDPAADMAEAR